MIRKLLLTAIVFTISLTAWSQSGTLKGKVTDKDTKEPIPFANVVVDLGGKIVNGATTDFDGKYTIKPIPPGKYDIKITYVGYKNLMIQGVLINADKIRFLDVQLESTTTTLETFEVVDYKVPLIDKDQTSTGGTMTNEELTRMAGRSATAVAVTVGGVDSDENGNMSGIRGGRSGGTATFIDGVRVIGSSTLPQAAIDQVTVITGGTPAMYGDFTGGIVNITTRGPSRKFGAGFEAVTSELLDGYGYNLFGFSVQGPLIKGKDSTKSTALLGFFISGEGSYVRDGSPASTGTYKVNDETLDWLRANPVRPSGTGFGAYNSAEFIHMDELENMRTRINATSYRVNLAGKLDVRTTDYTNLTFGGSLNYTGGDNWSYANTLYNYDNNGITNNLTYRVYGKFTQRFPTAKESRSLVKNVFYSVQADYTRFQSSVENRYHGDDIFKYGYVGKFDTYKINSYELGSDTVLGFNNVWIHNGFRDTLYAFTASDINPNLSNYTDQYYGLYDINSGFYTNALLVQNGGALLNGQLPDAVYGIWSNTGTPYNGYAKTDNSRIGFNANGSADVGNHALKFGLQYEQRSNSSYSLSPARMWDLMRGLINRHIAQLDLANPNPVYDANGVFQDTINYNRLYDGETQAFFDKSVRNFLGLKADGLDWVDIDSYDPTMFSLDMFNADELLNGGNSYVSYFGFDHRGNKLTSRPSFEDFFTQVDEDGNLTRTIGAYEPIYIAGYIQDQFAFNDLIFTIGVRVDRFDANQKVLKDPYLLSEAKTAQETRAEGLFGDIPNSIGDDYVVYVNDLYNPSAIVGYRNGTTWFNSQGEEITDPTVLETASGIAPYLQDPNDDELSPSAFKDYDPQTTIMPRISFSFPISDEALFFAHYDVLTSRPTSGNRLNPISYFFLTELGNTIISNPDLRPERTTDYELGFQQKLTNSSSLKFSAYYREFRDQIQAFRFSQAYPISYISYSNIDFGTTKGMTVAYDLRRTKNLWMKISYTLQFANATGSSATSGVNLVATGMPNLRTLNPINQDRNHTVNIIADYRYGRGAKYNGPTITRRVKGTDQVKVMRVLENTGVNLTLFGGSGRPYSRQSNVTSSLLGAGSPVLEGSLNGSRLPWQFRMDLRLDRDFYIKSKNGKSSHYLNVYLLVLNVLNTRNVMGVYRYTGNPDDDGYLQSADFQAQINSSLDPTAFRDLYSVAIANPYNYSLPRRIRLGVMFNF
jgi:outer membrane receptor protein involved in Fe transport